MLDANSGNQVYPAGLLPWLLCTSEKIAWLQDDGYHSPQDELAVLDDPDLRSTGRSKLCRLSGERPRCLLLKRYCP